MTHGVLSTRGLLLSAFSALALLVICSSANTEHVQMHSIAPPILAEYWENGLRYWSFGSNAVVTDNYVRITGPAPTSRGYFWNRHPNHLESFEANFTVRLLRRQQGWFADTTDGGLAFWYTAATPRHVPTNFYGSNAAFEGLGVIFDHSDHISVLVNDGDAVANVANSRLGTCRISSAGERDITIIVRYDNEAATLDLLYLVSTHGKGESAGQFMFSETAPVLCAHVPQVQLPTRNYFGVTATNTKTAQANHELVSFYVKPLHGGHDAEDEEIEAGLHLFDLKQEKQLQKEWEGREDVEIIPIHKDEHHPEDPHHQQEDEEPLHGQAAEPHEPDVETAQ